MRFLSLIGILSTALSFGADLPKPSPEFVINYPGGEKQLLSKFRGKVVLVEFLYTTCSHCQHTAGVVSAWQNDYGSRGFQALGIGFNEMAGMLVPDFIKDFKPTFPVGFADRDKVLNYLGIPVTERFSVPQIVLIDRKGMIRVMSPPLGDGSLQDDKVMRPKIEELLSNGTSAAKPPTSSKASVAAAKPAAAK
jgi:thiol-disulfide isomerase/thioredoxin